MAYTSEARVREAIGLDEFNPTTTQITQFISYADIEIDAIMAGDALRYTETNIIHLDTRFFDLANTALSIYSVHLNNEEIPVFEEATELLDDPEVEKTTDTLPDFWNSTAATSSDTLSWDATYSYTFDRSLKIAKGAAGTSYWYSDDVAIAGEEKEFRAKGRVKVDANSSTHALIRLEFLDVDNTSLATFDSAAATIQVTQPSSASVLTIASDNATDTTQKLIVQGLVDNVETTETISLNGTSSVSTTKSFTSLRSLRLSAATTGAVTVTSNSAGVTNATFTAGQLIKEDWQELTVEGAAQYNTASIRAYIRCDSTSGDCYGDSFRLHKRNWKFLAGARSIEFMENLKKGDMIRVSYKLATDPGILDELSANLAALRSLAFISGGISGAENYRELKSGRYASEALFNRFKEIRMNIIHLTKLLKKMDSHNPDFIIGSFED